MHLRAHALRLVSDPNIPFSVSPSFVIFNIVKSIVLRLLWHSRFFFFFFFAADIVISIFSTAIRKQCLIYVLWGVEGTK